MVFILGLHYHVLWSESSCDEDFSMAKAFTDPLLIGDAVSLTDPSSCSLYRKESMHKHSIHKRAGKEKSQQPSKVPNSAGNPGVAHLYLSLELLTCHHCHTAS